MTKKTIQEILDEQRKLSKIGQKTEHSINSIIAASARSADYYKNSFGKIDSAEHIKLVRQAGIDAAKQAGVYSAAHKKRYEDPAARKVTGDAMKIVAQRPGHKENNQKKIKETWAKPELRKQASESHIKQWADEAKRKAQSKRMQLVRMNPVVTPEGIFDSTRAWANCVNLDKAMFAYRAKKNPAQYYKISVEEYIMLTGQDPFGAAE